MHELHQRRDAVRLATKGVRKQLAEMPAAERRERNLHDPAAPCPDRLAHAHHWMGGIHLIIPIGADQHQVLQIRPGQ
ncbi:hypothetical protein QA640_18415 [Bradyrhizobium sp. CB82]|uniref:hypothetical protein n=1 Tax=Bradyrhizobium sp. CB82 TaxID=3039159 RepID=UPI0024B216CD|nr:hypothetical protein [Bradyrhizobium sp. CB82]WFU45400.1 hypothetical protein QA640_18415 [Bradyrhizobium sp. CB82]